MNVEQFRANLWQQTRQRGAYSIEARQREISSSAGLRAGRAICRWLMAGTPYQCALDNENTPLSLEALETWYASSRRPEHAILLVTGFFHTEDTEKMARAWFSSWHPERASVEARVISTNEAPAPSRRHFQVSQAGGQGRVILACKLSVPGESDALAAQVLSDYLEGDLRSSLREKLGATYGVETSFSEFKGGTGILRIDSVVARDRLGLAVTAFLDSLKDVANVPLGMAALTNARLDVIRLFSSPQGAGAMMGVLLRYTELSRPIESIDTVPARIAAVSAEQLRALAAQCTNHWAISTVGDTGALREAASRTPGIPLETVP